MEDFSTYQLNDLAEMDELERRIGTEKFYAYVGAVYNLCAKLTPGMTYNIAEKIKAENRELFIKSCCQYILARQPKGESNVQFNRTFTELRGVQTFNEYMKELEELKKLWS
jgi:hypothetical protein